MAKISPTALISFYLVTPILLLVMLGDWWLFDGALKRALPVLPQQIAVLALLFELPHIIASFFSFADPLYLNEYRSKLLFAAFLVAATLVLGWFSATTVFLIYLAYTMYHVSAQQTGIGTLVMEYRSVRTRAWKWALTIFYILLALTAFAREGFIAIPAAWLETALSSVILIFTWLNIQIYRDSQTGAGRIYVACVFATALASLIAFSAGYIIFAILMNRFVHDVTAFYFYVVQDTNQMASRPEGNYLYRQFVKKNMTLLLVIPVLAILAANYLVPTFLLVSVALFHYYIESFMWKKGSLHRQNLAIG